VAAFPTLAGVKVDVKRIKCFANKVITSKSGKQQAASFQATSFYRYDLSIAFLRETGAAGNEMASMLSFLDTVQGRWDTFTFTDPYDGLSKTCRLEDDEIPFGRIVNGVWEIPSLRFKEVK
jgi:hypothetical protein